MKELKSFQTVGTIINTHFPIRRKHGKRWKWAQTRGSNPAQVRQNDCCEHSYHEVLNLVKTHHLKPGDVFYEKDSKHDTSEFLAMHGFMTSTFFWRLDCAAYYDYEIEFAFNNCPFEAEIRRCLRAFPLDRQAKEIQLKPDFKTFYNNVLKVQPSEFIFSFKR
ncbi:hypothetical protein [Mucilaginibacter sp.]|uniref:hypothetical protein n=1 Tax=Mucilaginibacter sp. TaxID=1882438 RepID=UPI0025D956AA|nr:hypothetical protein [Mucilaginibacter sp.]